MAARWRRRRRTRYVRARWQADADGEPDGPAGLGRAGALAAYKICAREVWDDQVGPCAGAGNQSGARWDFEVSESYASAVRGDAKNLHEFEGSRAVFFHADGKPIAAGDRLVQTDLANTYQQIAEHGTDCFYRGEFAKKIGDWMAANGGIMTAADFAAYEAKIREPLRSTYRGYQIVGFPPPSSGGVHVAQILNILENFDLRSIAQKDPIEATHITSEAFKLAFADRAYWLGDADFVNVPRGLTSTRNTPRNWPRRSIRNMRSMCRRTARRRTMRRMFSAGTRRTSPRPMRPATGSRSPRRSTRRSARR